ncbi:hypothetical protein EMIHUDRAFT_457784 [Emiliania huxleyi CCMP1516]|uniref:Uncharacterized protein n=2 Tax=Emiliania huxleyi TaxID=2903 RepID=A0A0D3JLD0_EMIH1|nr:hypothetical protein EMIHUDRAFT_457784 [Emiliania huxleyi CCMP1516]EOD24315.1 hypothetical protein EMIHUDRAFT_457784 [Emiliania huxleyi CCMP1516]|eukprot:XP_005776744.1 hypothetical protein EMIHUDRAFT_457784 [Emiliania huxleyi CCMP1516]
MRQEPGGPPSWLGCGAALTGGAALLSLFMLLHAEKADHSLALPWPLVLAPLLALPAGALLLIATRAASRRDSRRRSREAGAAAELARLALLGCSAVLLCLRLGGGGGGWGVVAAPAALAFFPRPDPTSWLMEREAQVCGSASGAVCAALLQLRLPESTRDYPRLPEVRVPQVCAALLQLCALSALTGRLGESDAAGRSIGGSWGGAYSPYLWSLLLGLACCASCAACAPRRPAHDYGGDGADGPRTRLLQSQGAYQGVRSDLAAATQL